ncbi:MAG TPA: CAP domain-containing protein [Pyrinomonadaceae bacterium]|nr:CAP domain-containing protein [Pyrinomonadaceae bacterium]
MKLERRTFVTLATPFVLSLVAKSQTPNIAERGGFDERQYSLVRQKLLDLLNEERDSLGLSQLKIDELACAVGNAHATDMVDGEFISHWGRDGRNAYERYTFAGGTDALMENVGSAVNIHSLAPDAVIEDFLDVHRAMMSEVPPNDGHRRTIINPYHTHVGFGLAYRGHNVKLDELYLARYLHIDPPPEKSKPNAQIMLTGRLLNIRHFLHEVDVYYQPLPAPPDITWLRTPRSLSLPEERVMLRPKAPEGMTYTDGSRGDFESADGRFRVPVRMFHKDPGIYTIQFWMRRVPTDTPFPGAQVCVRVE